MKSTFWRKELSYDIARQRDGKFEFYRHETGSWNVAPSPESEITSGGQWTVIASEEVQALIAEAPTGQVLRVAESSEWVTPSGPTAMSGAERFEGVDASVTDFWRFAMSDLRTNNVRGYLAEYLVAKAVGSEQNRVEWDAFDVQTPDGTMIEVKSSAYLQAWAQRKPSVIGFSSLRGKRWTPQTGYESASTYNADVYVFCVQTATDHGSYNPLDVAQWDFYVVPSSAIAATGQNSLSLGRVKAMSEGSVPYADLRGAIEQAARFA